MRQRGRGCAQHSLARVFPRQVKHTLNEPDGPDAAFGERGLRRLMQRRAMQEMDAKPSKVATRTNGIDQFIRLNLPPACSQ
jgi:hypothetical protein